MFFGWILKSKHTPHQEPTHSPYLLPFYLLTCPLTCLQPHLPTFPPTYLPVHSIVYLFSLLLPVHLITWRSTVVPTCLPVHLSPVPLLTCSQSYLRAHPPTIKLIYSSSNTQTYLLFRSFTCLLTCPLFSLLIFSPGHLLTHLFSRHFTCPVTYFHTYLFSHHSLHYLTEMSSCILPFLPPTSHPTLSHLPYLPNYLASHLPAQPRTCEVSQHITDGSFIYRIREKGCYVARCDMNGSKVTRTCNIRKVTESLNWWRWSNTYIRRGNIKEPEQEPK